MKSIRKIYPYAVVCLVLNLAASAAPAQTQERPANVSNAKRQKKPTTEAQPTDANGWYEQALRHAGRGNLELAIAAYEKFLTQTDIQKDAHERLHALRQQLEQKHLTEKLERRYASGKAALNARDWPRAVVEFETIARQTAGFRDTDKRLQEAQSKLASENAESMIVRLYALGVSALAWNEINEAQAAFMNVQRLAPNYRDTHAQLQRLESMRAQATPSKASTALTDSLTRLAHNAANKSDWMQAVIALEALHVLRPHDEEIATRLAEARTAHALSQNAAHTGAETSETLPLARIGGLAALLALPFLGWLYFTPAARAKRLLLRNDYRSAAKIYETELMRHPSRVKYFPKLAEIYLLEGRKDDEAMKIYRNVLQLNLAANHREEINAVVAQQYLQEGRTDSDAIEVLEKQLEAELNRQNRALVKVG